MTTPTPRTDALFMPSVHDGAPTKKLSHGELQVEFAKIERELAAAQEANRTLAEREAAVTAKEARLARELIAAQEARQHAEAERDANAKDAAQYRWLQEHCDSMSLTPPLTVARVCGHGLEAWSGDDLDAAIDAAREGK